MALLGGELEEADTFRFVGAGAGHAEDPADGRGFEAEHVVLDADGEVGVVEGGGRWREPVWRICWPAR